jgi:hypothetical protein
MKNTLIRQKVKLPNHILDLLWEYDKKDITWPDDADLIIRKVLEKGGWESVKWLITTVGYAWLKNWLIRRQGAGLDPKRLRFWQHVLNLSQNTVTKWIDSNISNPWQNR